MKNLIPAIFEEVAQFDEVIAARSIPVEGLGINTAGIGAMRHLGNGASNAIGFGWRPKNDGSRVSSTQWG